MRKTCIRALALEKTCGKPKLHLRVWAKLLLEDAKGAWAAHIMGHELVTLGPGVVTGLDKGLARLSGQDLFGQGHGMLNLQVWAKEGKTSCLGVPMLCQAGRRAGRQPTLGQGPAASVLEIAVADRDT